MTGWQGSAYASLVGAGGFVVILGLLVSFLLLCCSIFSLFAICFFFVSFLFYSFLFSFSFPSHFYSGPVSSISFLFLFFFFSFSFLLHSCFFLSCPLSFLVACQRAALLLFLYHMVLLFISTLLSTGNNFIGNTEMRSRTTIVLELHNLLVVFTRSTCPKGAVRQQMEPVALTLPHAILSLHVFSALISVFPCPSTLP